MKHINEKKQWAQLVFVLIPPYALSCFLLFRQHPYFDRRCHFSFSFSQYFARV